MVDQSRPLQKTQGAGHPHSGFVLWFDVYSLPDKAWGTRQNGDGGPCYYVLANPCGAANNGTPQTPQQPRPHGCGLAIAQGALSVGLDVVGAIPGFGNAVSATAAGARAVNGIVAYGGAAYGIGTGLGDESPVGAASAGAGLGPKEREAE
jgi:hypothetical protein